MGSLDFSGVKPSSYTAEGMIFAAGAIALLAGMKQTGGFPPNTIRILVGTILLAILVSFAGNGSLSGPVKAFAGLTLLASIVGNVSKVSNKPTKKKGK